MSSDTAAIRAELERILASESFATAGRHSRLLRYLVERTLAGEGEQLKEYVLGTEVFDSRNRQHARRRSPRRVERRRTGHVVHVVARIIDGRTDRKVWVGEYDVRRGDVPAAAAKIAADTAAAALEYAARIAR